MATVEPRVRDRRSYIQYCPAARALEVIGERWSLLIVRELLLGPKRFTDLRRSLPGIGPKVLSERLQAFRANGVITAMEYPPPLAATLYELTETGEALRGLVDELTRWGLRYLGVPRRGDRIRLSWLMRTLEASFRSDIAAGLDDVYEFTIDGETFRVDVADGSLEIRDGRAPTPDFVYGSDLWTFIAIGARVLDPVEAVTAGLATVEGDLAAGLRSIDLLGVHLARKDLRGGLLGAAQLHLEQRHLEPDISEVYEIRLGEQILHVQLEDGRAAIRPGPAATSPDAVVTADLATALQVAIGRLPLDEAVKSGALRAQGRRDAIGRALALFSPPPEQVAEAPRPGQVSAGGQ